MPDPNCVCKTCGVPFYVKPSKLLQGRGVYHSKKCWAIGMSEWLKQHHPKAVDYVKVTCDICGTPFEVNPARTHRNKHGFCCSPECKHKAMKGKAPWNKGKRCPQLSLQNHHAWKGGISKLPYCFKFNDEFKERVRAFFGHTCVGCGKSQEENGQALHVHHVDYNKMVCCDNDPRLFVILCRNCHTKTNFNRQYWRQHFREILAIQYGGKCYYTIEEMASIKN